ncbi:MAG: EAL domain-containing protein [Betaproteobacteria bacterium]|nr:EAL domain-containing protein [Betaproteobacteria bacterium]
MAARPSAREDERLARLAGYRILGTPPEPVFDDLVRRAQEALHAPMAWLSFHDGQREWVKAGIGIGFKDLPGRRSLVFGAGLPTRFVEIEDARESPLAAHGLVAGDPRVRFLAVAPLSTNDGHALGALVVADRVPRRLQPPERTAFENLATLAMARLEARLGAGPEVDALAAAHRTEELEDLLAKEREFTEAVIESLPGAFLLFSAEGEMLRWNARLQAATGYSSLEIAALNPRDLVAPADRAALERAIREALESGRESSVEVPMIDKAGTARPYAFGFRPVRIAGEACVLATGRDITERKRAEERTLRDKERLDLALTGSRLALWDWDLATNRIFFSEGWARLLGEPTRETTLPAEQIRAWNHPEDRAIFEAAIANAVQGVSEAFECEYRVRHASGDWIWIHSRGKVTQRGPDGRALRMTGTSTNVTKRKEAEERAEYLATRDALTGLPNRVLLHDRLEQAIAGAARGRSSFAFMFIDLDRFKTINDSLGHDVGDELLKRVAARLTACVRASDTVARLGGDEFAVIVESLRDGEDEGARQVAEKMILAMASPMLVGNQHLNTSCSIGIGVYPADGKDSATLMKHADVAMYYAKEKGRNNFQFFSAEMNQRAQERLSIENYLRLALRRGELQLHYQPRIRVDDGTVVAVEALIRWMHPRRGLLAPGKFIDVAEDSGLIVPMGEWVLEKSCQQLREWQRRLGRPLKLSVNLSVSQVSDGERLYRAVAGAVSRAGIDPATLELELTESLLMQNVAEKAALLNRLGELGVGLAIDDFGTGYSSLSYLKKLPVDAIKIDSSFVSDIGRDPNDEAIIRAIIAMAHSLRLSVVAEGVETESQLAVLAGLGCDEYQGFFASPALPPAEFERRYVK